MRRDRVRFSMRVLGLSILCAYICAAAYVLATFFSAGPNDQARGDGLLVFLDPFVLAVAIPVATVVALLAFPIALFCVWDRHLHRCTVLVIGLTTFFTFFATLFSPYLGLFGAPVVGLAASVFCRITRLAYFQPAGASEVVA